MESLFLCLFLIFIRSIHSYKIITIGSINPTGTALSSHQYRNFGVNDRNAPTNFQPRNPREIISNQWTDKARVVSSTALRTLFAQALVQNANAINEQGAPALSTQIMSRNVRTLFNDLSLILFLCTSKL